MITLCKKNYGFTKTPALADPFKKMACEWFGWNDRHLNGDLKEEIDPVWGFSPRQFFQVFGTGDNEARPRTTFPPVCFNRGRFHLGEGVSQLV